MPARALRMHRGLQQGLPVRLTLGGLIPILVAIPPLTPLFLNRFRDMPNEFLRERTPALDDRQRGVWSRGGSAQRRQGQCLLGIAALAEKVTRQ